MRVKIICFLVYCFVFILHSFVAFRLTVHDENMNLWISHEQVPIDFHTNWMGFNRIKVLPSAYTSQQWNRPGFYEFIASAFTLWRPHSLSPSCACVMIHLAHHICRSHFNAAQCHSWLLFFPLSLSLSLSAFHCDFLLLKYTQFAVHLSWI